jgi:hypothetical protein
MLVSVLVFLGLMALLGVVTKVALALIQRRRSPELAGRTLDEIAGRISRLEQLAESTALEVERIGEGQRFTTKLLSERTETPVR